MRDAGLTRSERHGVEMHNTLRAAEVDARYPGLLVAIAKAHEIRMTDPARQEKRAAKIRPMRSLNLAGLGPEKQSRELGMLRLG